MLRKLLLIGMIIIIFNLSSTTSLRVIKPSTWSNHTVYNKEATITGVFDIHGRFFDGYFPKNSGIRYADMNFFAHKISHITAYAVLSLLFLGNMRSRKNAYMKAWFLTVLIAALDEWNQFMVVGRTGLFLDVIVDSISAFVALTIAFIMFEVRHKKRSA